LERCVIQRRWRKSSNDFAFTFLVGIITGTYSSIYIASAFVLLWHKGERPKTAPQTQTAMSAAASRA
jgi:SecD/SecF fusion protein